MQRLTGCMKMSPLRHGTVMLDFNQLREEVTNGKCDRALYDCIRQSFMRRVRAEKM